MGLLYIFNISKTEEHAQLNYALTSRNSIFFNGWRALVGQGVLFVEVSRSTSDTPHPLVLLRTSDRPVAETFTRQYTTLSIDTDILAPGGIRIHNYSKRIVADPCLRPRGHLDRPRNCIPQENGATHLCNVKKLLSLIDKRRCVRSAGPLAFF